MSNNSKMVNSTISNHTAGFSAKTQKVQIIDTEDKLSPSFHSQATLFLRNHGYEIIESTTSQAPKNQSGVFICSNISSDKQILHPKLAIKWLIFQNTLQLRYFISQVEFLQSMCSQNLIEILDWLVDEDSCRFYIIMEYYPRNLELLIQSMENSKEHKNKEGKEIIQIMLQIMDCVIGAIVAQRKSKQFKSQRNGYLQLTKSESEGGQTSTEQLDYQTVPCYFLDKLIPKNVLVSNASALSFVIADFGFTCSQEPQGIVRQSSNQRDEREVENQDDQAGEEKEDGLSTQDAGRILLRLCGAVDQENEKNENKLIQKESSESSKLYDELLVLAREMCKITSQDEEKLTITQARDRLVNLMKMSENDDKLCVCGDGNTPHLLTTYSSKAQEQQQQQQPESKQSSLAGDSRNCSNCATASTCCNSKITSYEFKNGDKYTGEWKNGKQNGYGTYYYSTGQKYEGQWVDGKAHGKGNYSCSKGFQYSGNWANDKKHGYGVQSFEGGARYEGEFQNNYRTGNGTEIYVSGARYEGQFKNNKKHGQGVYIGTEGYSYTGDWKDDEKHGKGTYLFRNGDKYVGEWKDGQMKGQGTYSFSDGDLYQGKWKNDLPNGNGQFVFQNGERLEGKFKKGQKVGKWSRFNATGALIASKQVSQGLSRYMRPSMIFRSSISSDLSSKVSSESSSSLSSSNIPQNSILKEQQQQQQQKKETLSQEQEQ